MVMTPCWAGKRKSSVKEQEMKRRKIQEKPQLEEQLPEKDFFKVNPAWYEWLKFEKEQADCKLFEVCQEEITIIGEPLKEDDE